VTQGGGVDVSVVIVTYNSARDVGDALKSAYAAGGEAGLGLEVIVVDNASSDGTLDAIATGFPSARVIANTENVGFGRANNQAFEVAAGRHVLLLNPDARLDRGALGELVARISKLAAGGVAPSIGDRGAESCGMAPGIRSMIGHFLFVNRLLVGDTGGAWRGFQLARRRGSSPRHVEWASAAVLLLDTTAIQAVGGFDPSFFMYGEDVDLGMRLTHAGRPLWLVPSARATHSIAASQGGVSTRWVDSLRALYARQHRGVRLLVFDAVVAVGLALRAGATSARAGGRGDVHARRMRAAASRSVELLFRRN